jgi:hypothetical protein
MLQKITEINSGCMSSGIGVCGSYTLLLRGSSILLNGLAYYGFQALSQNCEKRLLGSSYLSVRMDHSVTTGRIFIKFGIWVFFQHLSRTFKFHYNRTKITGNWHEYQLTFLIMCIWVFFQHLSRTFKFHYIFH